MQTTSRRRSLVVLAAAALAVAGVALTAEPSRATSSFTFTRYAGANRYDTAAKVAVDTFGTADSVIITSGEQFPDALAGAYAAGLGNMPVLLTSVGSLPEPTSTALSTLKTTKAVILGGTGSVSANVETQLKAKGITTSRVAGKNRYETAQKIATDAGPNGVGKVGTDTKPTALLTSGVGFADALAAGPMSFAGHFPILLTTAESLSPEAKQAFTDLKITRVIIIGGATSVSPQTEAEVAAMGITTERLAGVDRTETATKVADFEVSSLGWTATHVDLASGAGFADALAGAAHGGKNKSPLLLTPPGSGIGYAKDWLTAHASTLASGHILGGTGAVTQAQEDEATAAAGGTPSGSTSSSSSSSSSSSITVPGSTSSSSSSSTSSTSSSSSTTSTTAEDEECVLPGVLC